MSQNEVAVRGCMTGRSGHNWSAAVGSIRGSSAAAGRIQRCRCGSETSSDTWPGGGQMGRKIAKRDSFVAGVVNLKCVFQEENTKPLVPTTQGFPLFIN